MTALYSVDVEIKPETVDIIDLPVGKEALKVQISGFEKDDVAKLCTLEVYDRNSKQVLFTRRIDNVPREDGNYIYLSEESILAKFNLTSSDVIATFGTQVDYSCFVKTHRNGESHTQEVQSGKLLIREPDDSDPIAVRSHGLGVKSMPYSDKKPQVISRHARQSSSGLFTVYENATSTGDLQVEGTLYLYDALTDMLHPVEIGPDDSAGSGYRLLRVSNTGSIEIPDAVTVSPSSFVLSED